MHKSSTFKKASACLLAAILLLSGCGRSKSTFTPSHTDVAPLQKDSEIFVEAVENLPDDFWLGVDVSTLLAQEESGVVYYGENGEVQDIMQTLKESGVNTVRIRVWNDPFDANGNSYGGGHNDLATAITIGQRATDYGMGVLIDFHYSDFWADPSKQMAPKAWAEMSAAEKCDALRTYTEESLNALLDAGVDVVAVQIGNETTTGMSGVRAWPDLCSLFKAGCEAVRTVAAERNHPMQTVLHFTNPENAEQYMKIASTLASSGVDYDIFASSYYPFWHGTLENLTNVLSQIAEAYDKKVMVAEVSYLYTYEDGDGSGNSVSADTVAAFPYSISVQGQANCIRDVVDAVVQTGECGVGVFYWEPAWIPVPGNSASERSLLWEEHGSGWASSYAGEYDPYDAGRYYGGSSWDNQALFDFEGHPLASLSVFRYLRTGATATLHADAVLNSEVVFRVGEDILLPETATVVYNSGEQREQPVTWTNANIDAMSTGGAKTWQVNGVVTVDGEELPALLSVEIRDLNFLENYGFEDADLSMWDIQELSNMSELYVIEKQTDAVSGTHSLHFYSTGSVDFTVEQTVTGLEPGTYYFQIALHGGDANNQDMYIYAVADGVTYTEQTDVDGWTNYRYPRIAEITTTDGTITVGAHITCGSGAWGNLDDFILAPVASAEE